jgi:hypothetical protein
MSGDVALATPETPPSAAPPAPAWLKRLIPTFTDDFQVKILDAKGHIHWQSNAGPQTWALFSPYDEQAWGGRRGGGKTAALIAWMTMGDWSLPDDDPARLSFLNDSSYRGLLLRESYQDMAEFVEEAKAFYKVFGGKATDDPTHIDFKSGARIYFNHLQSEDAFNKYKGWNITRIGIEELTQIKTQRQYLRLQGSLRSTERVRGGKTFPPLRTLIVGTTNPDGPGAPWVKARFVSVLDNYGKRIPPNTPILDPISGLKSIFIPFPIDANPYYAENTTAGRSYRARLMAQDEVTRRQWVEGDWDVGSGQFFCCDNETDFLTIDGFKRVEEIKLGELIATRGPSGRVEYAPCEKITRERYEGDLLYHESSHVNFAVTPNHNMFMAVDNHDMKKGPFSFRRADSLPSSSFHLIASTGFDGIQAPETISFSGTVENEHNSQVCVCPVCNCSYETKGHRLRHRRGTTCSRKCSYVFRAGIYGRAAVATITKEAPASFKTKTLTFEMGDWLEFFGWFISEGCVDKKAGVVQIAQKKHIERVERIKELLIRMGFTGNHHGNRFKISSKILSRVLSVFGKSHQKYIPREYLQYGGGHLRRLYDGLVLGDGFETQSGGNAYYTVSKQLANDVQEIALKLGMRATISERKQSMGRDVGYYVGIYAPGHSMIRVLRSKIQRRPYSGYVGCVTVRPHHTIMIRRRGCIMWTGNSDYRPDGPIGEEEKRLYPWARHLVAPVPLRPWWYRWGDGDWGWRHPSCYHKLVRNEADGRIHIYDELQVRNVGSFEQGAMLARWWQHDLIALKEAGRDPCVVIYMSGVHGDVFSKDDASKSKAEQILAGIREVLGPFGALLLKYDENEREVMLRDKQRAQAMFEKRRQELAGHICIALKPIYFDRVSAWDYLRDCLRFRPARLAFANQDERERYLREVLATEGRESYERIRTELERVKPEILPRLQIWDCCRELDRCFRVAQCDMSNEGDPSKTSRSEDVLKFNANSETGEGGDDALDAARLGVLAYKEIQTQIPLSYFVSDRIEEAKEACLRDTGEALDDPTRLAMISRQATANYGKLHAPAKAQLYLPRASSQRHRRNP